MFGRSLPDAPTFQEVLFYKNFFLSLSNVIPRDLHLRNEYLVYSYAVPIDPFLSSPVLLTQWVEFLIDSVKTQQKQQDQGDLLEGFTSHPMTLSLACIAILFGLLYLYWRK